MRRLLLIPVLGAACVAGVGAVLFLDDDDPEPAVAPRVPVDSGPIRFVLDDVYTPRERVRVKIENIGAQPYRYETEYAACFLSYFDSSGRKFVIPPGTHCDILAEDTIEPGEVRTLFAWRLNECVKDRWGCAKARPLPPGTYTMRGRFKPEGNGPRARARATFRIAES